MPRPFSLQQSSHHGFLARLPPDGVTSFKSRGEVAEIFTIVEAMSPKRKLQFRHLPNNSVITDISCTDIFVRERATELRMCSNSIPERKMAALARVNSIFQID